MTLSHASGNNSETWTVSAGLSAIANNVVTFRIYTGTNNFSAVTVSQIVLTDSNGHTATLNPNVSIGTSPTSFSTNISTWSTSNASFNIANVNAISIDFSVSASGSKTFQLDAIDIVEAPEPSSIALFALGLAGLGWGASRRKKRRTASAQRAS
jgi:hypothetical protein